MLKCLLFATHTVFHEYSRSLIIIVPTHCHQRIRFLFRTRARLGAQNQIASDGKRRRRHARAGCAQHAAAAGQFHHRRPNWFECRRHSRRYRRRSGGAPLFRRLVGKRGQLGQYRRVAADVRAGHRQLHPDCRPDAQAHSDDPSRSGGGAHRAADDAFDFYPKAFRLDI